MRTYFFVILALAVGGVAASIALIPRDKEVALMNFLDAEFESAQQQYLFQLLAGDWSIDVVIPLTQLYLQNDEPDEAADLMQEFVRRNPEDVEARLILGQYLQFAERPDAYLQNLVEMSALDPTVERFRELSDIYSFNGDVDAQIDALLVLTSEYEATPEEFKALASLLASRDRFADALVPLQSLSERHPESVDADVIALYADLLLEQGRPQDAVDITAGWLALNDSPPNVAARLAQQFAFQGFPQDGLRLLRPLEDVIDDNPSLLAAYTRIQSSIGAENDAFDRLQRLHAAGRLPQEAADILIDFALDRDQPDLALAVADAVDLSNLPVWMLVSLAETAVAEERADFSQGMIDRLGLDFLANRPALAAEIFQAAGDESATREWITRAEAVEYPIESESSSLARVYVRFGEYDAALERLTGLVMGETPSPGVFDDLIRVYRGADRAAEGATFFDGLRGAVADPIVDTGWAILTADSGLEDPVLDWLDGVDDVGLSPLTDLYFVAGDRGQDRLRLAAVERLYDRRPDETNQGRMVRAVLDARLEGRFLSDVRDVIEDRLAEEDAASLISKLRARGSLRAADVLQARGAEDQGSVPVEEVRALRRTAPGDRESRGS